MDQHLNNFLDEGLLTKLDTATDNLQGSFDLDVYRRGTKFSNSGIYQAVKECHLGQLQRCIEYGNT